jgi:hypothetical protein
VDYDRVARILVAVGMAEASGQPLDRATLAELATESSTTTLAIDWACGFAHAAGLVHLDAAYEEQVPRLMNAGRQYLARRGKVDPAALTFLPYTIDDLEARRALLHGGRLLVDEFRHALLAGRAVSHAASLVPDAFGRAVTERIALDLFAAAVALMARLEAEQPAACVAEELLAIELITYADSWLEVDVGHGTITPAEASAARVALPGLFGLFHDGDVIRNTEMKEPADAAVARADGMAARGEVADHRIEAWFRPFAGALATGYLATGQA